MGNFNRVQQEQLLKPLNPSRVAKRKQGGVQLSYLAQHDVRAHLIRLFGFGHFDLVTVSATQAYEHKQPAKSGSGELFNVGYLVTMRLTIRDENQNVVCEFSESAVGAALSGDRGEAHDNAVKNGSSDAMKRCAINLGDQFGLSLYEGGSTRPFVRGTLVNDDVPQSGVEAPQSHEHGEPALGDQADPEKPVEPSLEALEAQRELHGFIGLPAGDRITEVAKFKTVHREILDRIVDVDGQTMTLARCADLVAAGKFSDGNNNEGGN